MSLVTDLRDLINRHSREGHSNTPDFILAKFLIDSLEAFEEATKKRDRFYKPDDAEEVDDQPGTA